MTGSLDLQALPVRQICVVVDGSADARAALEWTVHRFMNQQSDELYLLSVTVAPHSAEMVRCGAAAIAVSAGEYLI